jgi:hypothetical protein
VQDIHSLLESNRIHGAIRVTAPVFDHLEYAR